MIPANTAGGRNLAADVEQGRHQWIAHFVIGNVIPVLALERITTL
jgi:hypothetical protein